MGSEAGTSASAVVEGMFLALFLVLLWRIGRASMDRGPARPLHSPADAWGSALLLLALAMPYLLPWYVAWFAPFIGLMRDEVLRWVGVAAAGLLAITLIPSDPFRGYSTWGVMATVHYVVAPLMLVLLVVAALRVVGRSPLLLRRWSEPS